jgi:hypothetical protein
MYFGVGTEIGYYVHESQVGYQDWIVTFEGKGSVLDENVIGRKRIGVIRWTQETKW